MKIKGFTPNTINEAIDYLYNNLSDEDIKYINENKNHGGIHHFTGMAVRNEWGFWKDGTPFKKDMKERFNLFGHGDDCSGLVFTGLWAKVKGQDVEEALKKEATRYYNHWKKTGLNPETGKRIKGFKGNDSYVIEFPPTEDDDD